MWVKYNPNPVTGRSVEDCAIRALAKALDVDWETAYVKLAMNGFSMGDLPNSNIVIMSVLRQNNFKRVSIPNNCPDCYTIKEFSEDHPHGTYFLGTGNHTVAVVDGNYYDAWDCGNEVVAWAWKKS